MDQVCEARGWATLWEETQDVSALNLTSLSLFLSLPVTFLKQSQILSLLDLKSLLVPAALSRAQYLDPLVS